MPGITLNNRLVSYDHALTDDQNILFAIEQEHRAKEFNRLLWDQKRTIESVVRHHLGLKGHDVCTVSHQDDWIQGGFNVCIPVHTQSKASTKELIFRCPMPHTVAGSVDEKVCCEAATYGWMGEFCPEIRVPALYAFGLSATQFTHIKQRSFLVRFAHLLRQWLYRLLKYPLLSNYTRNATVPTIDTTYLLLERIGPDIGQMLSLTWDRYQHDGRRKQRLYRGIARIFLSLAQIPQARIGSFRFNPLDCTISLSNRPLTCATKIFESSGTPQTMNTNQTYQSADTFASDMLTVYDDHFSHDPHAVIDTHDAKLLMATRVMQRSVMHHFILPNSRHGPFIQQLTDLHQSNIFVDGDWNVTCLIDLDFTCSLPREMLSVPYWLTGCSIDGIVGTEYHTFDKERRCFLSLMDEEQWKSRRDDELQLTRTMETMWTSGGFWFWASLWSVDAWIHVFKSQLRRTFSPLQGGEWQAGDEENDTKRKEMEEDWVDAMKNVYIFFRPDSKSLIETKVRQEESYQEELSKLFKACDAV